MNRETFMNMLDYYAAEQGRTYAWRAEIFHRMYGSKARVPQDVEPMPPTCLFLQMMTMLEAQVDPDMYPTNGRSTVVSL